MNLVFSDEEQGLKAESGRHGGLFRMGRSAVKLLNEPLIRNPTCVTLLRFCVT